MSRHVIRDDDEFLVVVGWDPPLNTLFGQVWKKALENNDDAPMAEFGFPYTGRIHDIKRLRVLVSEWAEIDSMTIGNQLAREMD